MFDDYTRGNALDIWHPIGHSMVWEERQPVMHRCKCGRRSDEPQCLYCQSDIGWENVYPLPVDVYIKQELGWADKGDIPDEAA